MAGFFGNLEKLFTGTPGKRQNVSTLRPEQESLYQQLQNAGMNKGAGGAFGDSADYYRNLLSNDSADYNDFAAPQMRQFNEQTIPGLAEQFAGMGAGGLSSSGFRNAAVGAGADLSERLGALRASLRQQGAQGLFNIGQQGLQSYSQNMQTEAPTEGLFAKAAPAFGTALGSFAGPFGSAFGGASGNWLKNYFGGDKVGSNELPQGYNAPNRYAPSQPMQPPRNASSSNGFNLPNFIR